MLTSSEQQQAALKEIHVKLREIHVLYRECETIAEKAKVSFQYNGPAGYGDSGYFWPDEEGWVASSQSCS